MVSFRYSFSLNFQNTTWNAINLVVICVKQRVLHFFVILQILRNLNSCEILIATHTVSARAVFMWRAALTLQPHKNCSRYAIPTNILLILQFYIHLLILIILEVVFSMTAFIWLRPTFFPDLLFGHLSQKVEERDQLPENQRQHNKIKSLDSQVQEGVKINQS